MPRVKGRHRVTALVPVVDVAGVADSGWDKVDERITSRVTEEAPLEEKPPKPTRVKTSSFHITVNTNQRYGSKSAIIHDMRPLYDGLKNVFGDPALVERIIEILTPGDDFLDSVGHVSSDIGIEYSPVAGLHAHCLVTITHKTKLRIQLKNLRGILDKTLPHLVGNAPHVFVRFVPDQKQTVMNYIYKTVNNKQLKMREGLEFSSPPVCKCDCKIADLSPFFSE